MLKKRLNIMEDGKPCDCGCNETVADDPIKMLKFLAGRLRHAGVSECVGSGYADDIEQILEGGYITLSITEYEQLLADKRRLDGGEIILSGDDGFGGRCKIHHAGCNLREAIDAAIAKEKP